LPNTEIDLEVSISVDEVEHEGEAVQVQLEEITIKSFSPQRPEQIPVLTSATVISVKEVHAQVNQESDTHYLSPEQQLNIPMGFDDTILIIHVKHWFNSIDPYTMLAPPFI
jgi:hypothetical protein